MILFFVWWMNYSFKSFLQKSESKWDCNVAGKHINTLLQDELRGATLLVFANKQDLPNAMSVSEITDKLGLHSLRQRRW